MYIFWVYKCSRIRYIRFVLVYYILRFFWESRRFIWLRKTTPFRDSRFSRSCILRTLVVAFKGCLDNDPITMLCLEWYLLPHYVFPIKSFPSERY
jgi:hypothetical protein